jgi:O-antigen ligase
MTRALLLTLLAASLASFGGTYRWTTVPLWMGAAAVFLSSLRTIQFPVQFRTLDVALAAIAGTIALQLVPLPISVRHAISPEAGRVAATVQLLPVSVMRPLSLDPVATRHALATFTGAVLVFWTARGLFAHGGTRSITRGIAVIGGVAAALALVQRLGSPRLIYGFWEPGVTGATPLGPFINRNHFAAWLMMALPVAVGYFIAHFRIHVPDMARERHKVRALFGTSGRAVLAASVVMMFTLGVSLSRSALAGLLAAAVVGWQLSRSKGLLQAAPRGLVFAVAACIALIVLATINPDHIAARVSSTIQQTGTNRLTIWRETLPMIRDFWIGGVGAGSYAMGMLVYQQTRVPMAHLDAGGWAHFNHAHSHYLQVAAEGGLTLTAVMCVAVIALLGAARQALRSHAGEGEWIRVGALAALAGIAVQSLWETALRMPANAMLCAVIAALAVHQRSRPGGDRSAPQPLHELATPAAGAADDAPRIGPDE